MKKIGIVVNSIGYGGNERSAVNIAKALSKQQYDVSIIIQEDCGNHYKYEGHVYNLNTPCADSVAGKVINSLRRITRLKRIIRRNHIDTCFIILPVTNPINYIRFSCKKIVSCRHCGDLMDHTDQYVRMTEKSDLIVCNSRQQTEFIVRVAPHLKDKARTIYNILDIEQIQCLCEMSVDSTVERFMTGNKCIISSGRLVNQKGMNNLIKAFSIVARDDDSVRLILIGEGNIKAKTEDLIKNLDLCDRILFTGFLDNPFRYISRSCVFALSSFYEGFPNTLVEAMACGTPVVACDCPSGPAEILDINDSFDRMEVGKGGILVRAFDEGSSNWDPSDIREEHQIFADALKLIISDKELRKQLADAAIERTKDFSAEIISKEWRKIL